MKTIQEAVAEKIATSGDRVTAIVIDDLAYVEISKRVNAITNAIGQADKIKKEWDKINKNDLITFVDGRSVEAMSKNRFDDIRKAKEKFESINSATNAALETNTTEAYNKLYEILKKVDDGKTVKTDTAEG